MANKGGYIGRNPGDSAVIIARQNYSPTGVQTDFTFNSGYTPGYVDVYLNGVRLIDVQDYTASAGNTVGLTSAAISGDIVEVIAYKAFNVGNVSDATSNFNVGGNLTVSGDTNVSGSSTFVDVNISGVTTASGASYLTGASYLSNVTEFVSSGIATVSNTTDSTSTTTGALQVRGGVGVALSMHVGGNLSVGGTVTYEDVTNVDSLGIVTARSGLRVVGGGLTVTGGKVGIGTDNPEKELHVRGDLLLEHNTGNHLTVRSTVNNGNDPNFSFEKGRGGTGITTSVQDSDDLGRFTWKGYDGSAYIDGAFIISEIDGTPGIGTMPTKMALATRASGGASAIRRLGIESDGTVQILNDGDFKIPDKIIHDGDTDTAIRFPAANTFSVETAGTEKMRIRGSGKVGIGTTNPSSFLHVVGSNYQTLKLENNDNSADGPYIELYNNTSSPADDDYIGMVNFKGRNDNAEETNFAGIRGRAIDVSDGSEDGRLTFHTRAAGTYAERLRIKSTGELIQYGSDGMADGSADDLVIGDLTGSVNRGMTIYSHNAQNGSIAFADNDSNFRGAVQYMHNGDRFRFLTGGQETLRLQSGGTDGVCTFFMGGVTNNNNKTGALTLNHYTFNTYNQIDLIKGTSISGVNKIELGGSDSTANSTAATSIQFYTAANATTNNGTQRMTIAANGRVGIASTVPQTTLDVLGELTLPHNNTIRWVLGTTTKADMYSNSGGTLIFRTTGSERMRLTSTGLLGIGTNNPLNTLHLNGQTSGVGPILQMSNNTGDCRLFFGTHSTTADANAQGQIRYNVANNYLAAYTAGAERVRITSNGRVLIGTGAVAAATNLVGEGGLQVSTNGASGAPTLCLGADGTGANTQTITDNTAKDARIGFPNYDIDEEPLTLINGFVGDGSAIDGNSGARIYIGGGTSYLNAVNSIRFYTTTGNQNTLTGDERMRISSAGHVLISKTSTDTTTAGHELRAGAAGQHIIGKSNTGTVNGIYFHYNSTYVGGLNYSNTATSLATSSDYRIKENVVAVSNAITRTKQLNPVQFNFIADPDATVEGFIAHELGEVVPEACFGEKDAVDDDGNIKPQSAAQDKVIPLLTAALQEAIAKIETLETKVAALES